MPRRTWSAGRRLRAARATALLLSTAIAALLHAGSAGAVMREKDCDNLAVSLEPAADFRTIRCESGETGFGEGGSVASSIEAEDALSFIVVFHNRAGSRTYLERRDPKTIFAEDLEFAVEGSWQPTTASNGFSVSKFFGKFDFATDQVPCFAFTRYAGHVEHSTGYRHLVAGFYCEFVPSDQPVTAARVDQMTGKIKADMF
jgi:hypothetical protein